ncbi:MAG: hypothetical protein JRH20_32265, partial [Deltaproteobacteria bacterium]|nr:hypothetical protein [Deltaproteobacteria bacterium]
MHTSSTRIIRGLVVGLVAVTGLVWVGCDPGGVSGGANRNTQCDDGTTPTCEMVPPTCDSDDILAYQSGCYACVDPDTCEPRITPGCSSDTDCGDGQWCDPCGTSSCPGCLDCRAACMDHDCVSDGPAICRMVQPECGDYGVAVVRDGC